MKNRRIQSTQLIGEDNLKKLDEAGLVIVEREERDLLQSQLDGVVTQLDGLTNKEDKTELINSITKLLSVKEKDICSKIRQLQQALKPFAALANKVPPDYTLVLNAKNVLGESIDVTGETIVKQNRRESIYVPQATTISSNKKPKLVPQKKQATVVIIKR